MKRLVVSFSVLMFGLTVVAVAQDHPFAITDLLKVRRVADPQVSPKGDLVAYTITDIDKEANRGVAQIYVVPIGGGTPRQLTSDAKGSASPRWSPDGSRIAFIREDQVWTMDASGGALKQVTTISTGAGDPVWSPDGNWLAFASDVYPDCPDDACNKRRAETAAQSKVKAHVAERLLYRHWKTWKDGLRSHVFVVSAQGGDGS